jgi:DNA modification methylase
MSHYIKIILDEIFDNSNFRNEIIWRRTYAGKTISRNIPLNTDFMLWYSRTNNYVFYPITSPLTDKDRDSFNKNDNDGRGHYSTVSLQKVSGPTKGTVYDFKDNQGKIWECPKKGWRMTYDKLKNLENDRRLYFGSRTLREKYYLFEREAIGKQVDNLWIDIGNMNRNKNEDFGYPTQKPEKLIERIMKASTNRNDLVLDCFAGSGTTGAVAEKLGRRWIMCDFGKHAIYTMQKRIWQIDESKKLGLDAGKNEKYTLPPKAFAIVSAGVYDFSKIIDLRKNKDAYINFVLGLFGIIADEKDYTAKYKLNNICAEKENNPVEVFPIWDDDYLKNIKIDEEYLKEIVNATGSRIKGDYYIITPEICTVVGNTTLKNSTNEEVNFILLKFPYKLLEDFSRQMQIEEQPDSQENINKLISSSAFYFNEEVRIKLTRTEKGFRVNEFQANILDKNNNRFKGLDGLSMLLIDKNYDGKVFNLDAAVYKKDIAEDGTVKIDGLNQYSAVIAIDKHGNESEATYLT